MFFCWQQQIGILRAIGTNLRRIRKRTKCCCVLTEESDAACLTDTYVLSARSTACSRSWTTLLWWIMTEPRHDHNIQVMPECHPFPPICVVLLVDPAVLLSRYCCWGGYFRIRRFHVGISQEGDRQESKAMTLNRSATI